MNDGQTQQTPLPARSRRWALGPALAWIFLLAVAGPIHAQATRKATARPPAANATPAPAPAAKPARPRAFGQWTADIRDFGASTIPGFDNTAAIQTAHDWICSRRVLEGGQNDPEHRGIIFIPSGRWMVEHPIFIDGDFVEVAGEGPSSVIDTAGRDFPPLILGVKRYQHWKTAAQGGHLEGLPTAIPPGQRLDLFGKVDAAAVPARTQRWGVLNRQSNSPYPYADHSLRLFASPASHGPRFDGWETSRALLVECAVERAGGGAPSQEDEAYPLLGIGESAAPAEPGPLPWTLTIGNRWGNNPATPEPGDPRYYVWFRCQEDPIGPDGWPPVRCFSFGNTRAKGVQKLAFQIDLEHDDRSGLCPILAFVNGVQVAVTRGQGTDSKAGPLAFTASKALHLRQNDLGGFSFGAWRAGNDPQFGRVWPGGLYGLRIGIGPIYADDGVGRPQRRLDRAPLTDLNRYFAADPSTLCFLPMTDRPHEPARPHDRLVTVQHGPAGQGNSSYGIITESKQEILYPIIQSNSVHHLALRSNINGWGAAIGIGCAFHCTIADCQLDGGYWGIGDLGGGGYYYTFRNLSVSAWGAGLAKTAAIIDLDGMGMGRVARQMILLDGCNASLKHLIVNGPVAANPQGGMLGTECFVKILGGNGYGCNYVVEDLFADIEETHDPKRFRAGIVIERHPIVPSFGGTSLTVREIKVNTGTDIPAISLVDRWPASTPPGVFRAEGLLTSHFFLKTDGPHWRGTIDATMGPAVSEWVRNTGPDALGNVVASLTLPALPTNGRWTRGARISILNPAPGQPSDFLCTQDGDFAARSPHFEGLKSRP